MQKIDFEEKFKRYLQQIKDHLDNFNYDGCLEISSKLTVASLIVENKVDVFISENLEWMFKNIIESLVKETDEKEKKALNEYLTSLIDDIIKTNLEKDDELYELYKKLVEIRYKVTSFQFNQWTKRRRRLAILERI